MNKIFLSAVAVSCMACNPVYDEMAIDYKYTPEELSIIHDSINEWHEATGSDSAIINYQDNMVLGDSVFDNDDYSADFEMAVMQKVSQSDPGYQAILEDFESNIAGVGREGEMIITITEQYTHDGEISAPWFKCILLHELGHFFGLTHYEGRLMRPKTNLSCIDQLTVDIYCDLKGDCTNQHSTCFIEETEIYE